MNQWIASIAPAVGLWLALRHTIRTSLKEQSERFDLKLDTLRAEMKGGDAVLAERISALRS